ncbi:MAG: tRNA 2-thiouridine(34) synthase MnmA [Desulfuromonadales bacterium]
MSRRVVVAMSGGVDSSVSAALLKEQGYDVTGVSLQLYDPVRREPGCTIKTCCSLDDVLDAGRVAKKLGIPFEVIDLRAEFKKMVIDYFIAEYAAGRTPNPCIRCNDLIKFELLLNRALAMGADFLATGHYVRVTQDEPGTCQLRTGLDPAKDQSYFLFTLNQSQLSKIMFPVGMLEKRRVREIASSFGLPVAQKHESQEICFIPDNDYIGFLERNGIVQHEGDVVTTGGEIAGRHKGIHRHTVGQRKGLGIAWRHPLHVVALDREQNRVVVGASHELLRPGLTAQHVTWIEQPTIPEFRASCRIRYRHRPTPCQVTLLACGRFSAVFEEPQMAVTPGQAAVLYDGDRVLGGGWIE